MTWDFSVGLTWASNSCDSWLVYLGCPLRQPVGTISAGALLRALTLPPAEQRVLDMFRTCVVSGCAGLMTWLHWVPVKDAAGVASCQQTAVMVISDFR
jgi:hypothetical protein